MILIEIIGLTAIGLTLLVGFATKGRFFRSASNRIRDAADKATEAIRDPVADGKIAIQDAKQEVLTLKQQRRELLVEISSTQSELQELVEEETKWEELARSAGKAGNATDVATCLAKKQAVTVEMQDLRVELEEYTKLGKEMTDAIASREQDIEEAQRSSSRLIKTMKLDKFRQKVATDLLGEGNSTSASLKALREDARKARSLATAMEIEAKTDKPTLALEEKYAVDTTAVSEDLVKQYMLQS